MLVIFFVFLKDIEIYFFSSGATPFEMLVRLSFRIVRYLGQIFRCSYLSTMSLCYKHFLSVVLPVMLKYDINVSSFICLKMQVIILKNIEVRNAADTDTSVNPTSCTESEFQARQPEGTQSNNTEMNYYQGCIRLPDFRPGNRILHQKKRFVSTF